MPQPTLVEWLKLYTGSSGAHLAWERKKKEAGKFVDVSVFKDGLGPAIDALGRAMVAESTAAQKRQAEVTRGADRREVYGPNYMTYDAAYKKAAPVTVDRWTRLERVLKDYVKLCEAKKAQPKDKLTKAAGPTSPAAQAKVWAALSDHLQKLLKSISERPQIARIDDKFAPRTRA